MKKTVLVCGGRDFAHPETDEWNFLNRKMSAVLQGMMPNIRIITGGAKGVDTAAEAWAEVNGVEYERYPADWEKFGKPAGMIRNRQMLDDEPVDLVIAFPGGPGTEGMIALARKRKIPVIKIIGSLPVESGV